MQCAIFALNSGTGCKPSFTQSIFLQYFIQRHGWISLTCQEIFLLFVNSFWMDKKRCYQHCSCRRKINGWHCGTVLDIYFPEKWNEKDTCLLFFVCPSIFLCVPKVNDTFLLARNIYSCLFILNLFFNF